jgi:hypothetical protein
MKLIEQILRRPVHIAFGQALSGGGITSVDLVATRNANSVTVTASDGSAAPVPAADATNAGVMTAADRTKLDGLPVSAVQELATRASVPATTIGAGVSHIRTGGYASVGDGGDGLYRRVGTAPAHGLYVQSADGAVWELVARSGAINVLQAGADPTGVADSIQAFRACAAYAQYNPDVVESGGANGPTIIVPHGKYYWSDTFEPRAGITMIGFKRGMDGNIGTIIQVAADKTGIILPKSDTIGAGKEDPDDPGTKGANGSFLQGFRLESLGGTDPTKHGIQVRTPSIMLSHIEVLRFPGDGFNIRASVGGTQPADLYGNANLWRVEHCYAFDNQQNGFFISGSDANAGVAIGCNASNNGRWGFADKAFLTNVHIGHHAQGNGHAKAGENDANSETSVVTHNGDRWHVVPGQELAASTTEPGTDPSVWFQMTNIGNLAASLSFPAWQSGASYVSGGSYYFDQGAKLALGCYAEDDNAAAIVGQSQLIGGSNTYFQSIGSGGNSGFRMNGGNITGGGLSVWRNPGSPSEASRLRLLSPEDPSKFLSMFFDGGPNLGMGFGWNSTQKTIRMLTDGSSGSWAAEILTDLSTYSAGRGTGNEPGAGQIMFPNGVFLGSGSTARHLDYDIGPPAAGNYAKGDVMLNRAPFVQTDTAGVEWIVYGWKCVTTGTPGTWKTLWSQVSNPPGLS